MIYIPYPYGHIRVRTPNLVLLSPAKLDATGKVRKLKEIYINHDKYTLYIIPASPGDIDQYHDS